ncbi:MAG: hypothetical protein HPY66_2383 [Firmicutes bacterium]|nr:hypothetical protein [Bacillota bacterium]
MYNERKELIKRISELRQSNVICYIGGDRHNISTRIAPDIIPVFYNHLEHLGESERIDLFLYTKGGDVLTALRLVHLIYEYTDNFSVLIPYKCYSAGTLISLGASEIVMGKLGELSPVDPNITSAFNPDDPGNPQVRLPINVEDVYSFFSIAKDVVGIRDDDALAKIFTGLTEHVHPLAVGAIHRTYSLIRLIARKLLLTHMDASEEARIDDIINNLTEKLFAHNYMISRKEAREALKLPVSCCGCELERTMWKLYEHYKNDLLLDRPFIPEKAADADGNFSVYCGYIESPDMLDGYAFEGIIQKPFMQDENYTGNVSIVNQGWKAIERVNRI